MRALRHQYKYFIVFSFVFIVIAHCQPRGATYSDGLIEYDDSTGPVLLRIVDARNSAPLSNAAITLPPGADNESPRYTAANADGYALFPDVTAGPQLLRIRHPVFARGTVPDNTENKRDSTECIAGPSDS